jgi:hypothetical protein
MVTRKVLAVVLVILNVMISLAASSLVLLVVLPLDPEGKLAFSAVALSFAGVFLTIHDLVERLKRRLPKLSD